jgi:hypothetical protein
MTETYKIIDTNTNTTFSASFDRKGIWNITIKKGKLQTSYDLNHKEAEQLYFLLVDTIGTPSLREIV